MIEVFFFFLSRLGLVANNGSGRIIQGGTTKKTSNREIREDTKELLGRSGASFFYVLEEI